MGTTSVALVVPCKHYDVFSKQCLHSQTIRLTTFTVIFGVPPVSTKARLTVLHRRADRRRVPLMTGGRNSRSIMTQPNMLRVRTGGLNGRPVIRPNH